MDGTEDVVQGLAGYRNAEASYVEGAWAEKRGGLLLVSLGLPAPWANVAQVVGDVEEPAIALRDAWSRFAEAGRPMSVQVVDGATPEIEQETTSLALAPHQSLNGLVRRPASRPFAMPDGLHIERANMRTLDKLLDVQADAFETDRALLGRLHPPAALREPHLTLYAGFVDDEMVASAECFTAGGRAGISGVCTLAKARRRGIATAMTNHAIAQSGADVAWLLADDEDTPLYRGMGFELVCVLRTYVPA